MHGYNVITVMYNSSWTTGWPGLAAFFDAHLSEFNSFAAHGRLARIKFDDYYDDISGSTNATTPIPNYEADDDG